MTVRCEVSDGIATLSLNRPEARNGYTLEMADALAAAIDTVGADPSVRVVVLTGEGKDFCVGADLSSGSFDVFENVERRDWVEPATRVTRRLYLLDKPVIAAVRGAAVGVGSTMILPCDYRLASTDSRFGFVFSRRGIYPEGGSAWFLPRIVGLPRALDYLISGRLITPDEALSVGLVRSLHPPDQVLTAAHALASELISTTAPVSVAVIRRTLYELSGAETPDPVFALDSDLIKSCAANPDALEGVMSFLEKRAPKWNLGVPADLPPFLPWKK